MNQSFGTQRTTATCARANDLDVLRSMQDHSNTHTGRWDGLIMPRRTFFSFAALIVILSYGGLTQAADHKGGIISADEIVRSLKPVKQQELTRGLSFGGSRSKDKRNQGSIALHSILFEFNSAQLTALARRQLDELGNALNVPDLKDGRFKIAGHTDSVGSDDHNQRLSETRAETVVRYLVQYHGIEKENLSSVGFGETYLLNGIPGDSGDNRRVEVFNLGKKY